MTRTRAFIFARGGSKGVPGKNVKELCGKPLIGYAIEAAIAAFGSVIVSTDDQEVAMVARSFGAEVPFLRPAELASDTASELDAWRHALSWALENEGAFDVFVSIPTTSPFRLPEDLSKLVEVLEGDPATDIVLTGKEAERNPWFNMVAADHRGYVDIANRGFAASSGAVPIRRQDAPPLFDLTTVGYASRTTFLRSGAGLFDGRARLVEIPPERALDIDTPHDFLMAELLMEYRQKQMGEKD